MPEVTVEIQRSLQDCRVLIVEDDVDLAGELVDLLTSITGRAPTVAHCMEAALQDLGDEPQFDLAILDVMLPKSELEFEEIKAIEKRVSAFRTEIAQLERRQRDLEAKDRLKGIRYERATALKAIDDLVDSRGGITLIEQWKHAHSDRPWPLPTIFLTAISRDEERRKGRQSAGENSEWLVKPVSSATLREVCDELLSDGCP